ncbi:major facilitator superfamily MFS_1 [Anaeromyxobacter sp. K]|uniref:MFS transporter n=1 Tax=Anaeromyxobacter sp. (strain K) TaxID=447217 RepID=UPI00015F9894|nr:MFS transporter [Anaeromyxobacter sp. K]ACG72967.1 major facilitator superfamily MFS_1 [Anaeromyxobacter sp. K]
MPAAPSVRFIVLVLAVAAGASVGNLYLLQPLLPEVARAFSTSPRAVGVVSMLTQVGYGAGMFLFVPLGDVLERRRLMLALLGAVAVALLAVAASPTLPVLAGASLAVGTTTVVPQLALPLAAHVAPPEERGRAVGAVMGGLLVGILLARTASGFLGAHLGWRAVYVVAAALMVALAAALRALLPRSEPDASMPYPALLRSMLDIAREEPVLREAAALGALGFAAFSVFWSTLAFQLEARHGLGPDVAGLFGVLGAAGALAAPVLGRLADRTRPRANAGISIVVALAGFAVFAASGSVPALVAGVLLLDVGVQGNHVSNLARVHGRRPEARSRMNTIYMVTYFAGGALGTAVGTWAWTARGWGGVCAAGAAFLAAALALWALGLRRAPAPARDGSRGNPARGD